MIDGQLSVSPYTRGRYIVDKNGESDGPELSSGQSVFVRLGGQWIAGHIEHGGRLYTSEVTLSAERATPGYYFVADDGSVCGLCVGMRVQV